MPSLDQVDECTMMYGLVQLNMTPVELEKKISLDDNASVVKQYIKDNTLSKDIPEYLKLVNEKGDVNFSEEEIKHITKYFERNNLIVSDKNLGIKSAWDGL